MTGPFRITVAGDPDLVLDVEPSPDASADVRPLAATPVERAAGRVPFEVTVDGWVFRATAESAARATLRERAARAAAASGHHATVSVAARIPGRVVRVWVEPGQAVEAGERLLAIEAMKMENEVRAPRAGTVTAVRVEAGQPVELGAELVILE